ncbi:anthocyanidin 3-O-glucosyltransferase 2-like [Ipomoea triloba]|uniref:anthocyanidin 3-O-glucosyltransferase 2-like n=1 Tax=Ipomoea triloba TaxID=35885 RepID=UPI00125CE3A0|nr:anthocyanidin 3-O-glucosyltransferase 2-like [Ipomoea triloba]
MEDANNNIELVFVPAPAMGHFVSAVGTAKLLLQRQPQLSVTVLIMKVHLIPDARINAYIDSLIADEKDINPRLKLILLPVDLDALKGHSDKASIFKAFFDSQKAKVRDYCVNEIQNSGSGRRRRLAGFVVDMLCSSFMDVAEEFGVPTYVFYALGAAMLGLHLHFQSLKDDRGILASEFKDSDPDLNIPTYFKPFPVKLLPSFVLDTTDGVLDHARRIRQAKGVIVNTFFDLESHALESLSKDNTVPLVYPVGPILNLNGIAKYRESEEQILRWLDDQPASSVVYLCFGSAAVGVFQEPQVKEIAYALERSGQRFLWVLRKPSSSGSLVPTGYSNHDEVLPEGFLERTKSIGKVIEWASQSVFLAHPAVGGFVSHCGWNSVLESIWFGVPIATWPMMVDQQGNAFQLVREIGMAVDIKMDYKTDSRDPKTNIPIVPKIVSAKEIEIGITSLMDNSTTNFVRTKAKEVKEMSRNALEEGGSSFNFVESFFKNVITNLK